MHLIFFRSARFGKIAKMTTVTTGASQVPMLAGFHSGYNRFLGNDMGRYPIRRDCKTCSKLWQLGINLGNGSSSAHSLVVGLGGTV